MGASITTNGLTKSYGPSLQPALNNLTISIASGEIYGYLGANGAGKSTTIRLLLNFLRPSSGSAQIMGLDIVRDSVAVKRHVGYLAGDVALYPKVTGQELLSYLLELQGSGNTDYLKILTKRFEAELDKPIGTLSKGNRQKIGVIQALMHQPEVLILDEPTSGLDPLMQEVFYDALREARQRGSAILMSSHNLDEAQRVCDRVGIIKHGTLLREQAIGDRSSLQTPTFRVTYKHASTVQRMTHSKALSVVTMLDNYSIIVQPTGELAPALTALATADIVSLQSEQTTLEDEFISFYGDAVS